MRRGVLFLAAPALAVMVTFAGPDAYALGLNAKAKGKKVQADLVPAMACGGTATDPVDCDGTILAPGAYNSSCTFTKGKVKVQVGKDVSVQISGLYCGGDPLPEGLCVQVDSYNTIMDENIDKKGNSVPKTCTFQSISVEGTSNYTANNVGAIPCDTVKGKCKGTVPQISPDPCPDVDKINEVRRIRVFDGPEDKLVEVLPGIFLGQCDHEALPGCTACNKAMARPGQTVQIK